MNVNGVKRGGWQSRLGGKPKQFVVYKKHSKHKNVYRVKMNRMYYVSAELEKAGVAVLILDQAIIKMRK